MARERKEERREREARSRGEKGIKAEWGGKKEKDGGGGGVEKKEDQPANKPKAAELLKNIDGRLRGKEGREEDRGKKQEICNWID